MEDEVIIPGQQKKHSRNREKKKKKGKKRTSLEELGIDGDAHCDQILDDLKNEEL